MTLFLCSILISSIINGDHQQAIATVNGIEDELVKAQRLTEIALIKPEKYAEILLGESQKIIAKSSKSVALFPYQL